MQEKLISRLTDFIQFEREVRSSDNIHALGFTVCNQLRKLIEYDIAILLLERAGRTRVNAISGVSDFDAGSPLVTACESLCNHKKVPLDGVRVHNAQCLSDDLVHKLESIQLHEILTVSSGKESGVLVLVRNQPWREHEQRQLLQIGEVVGHAVAALNRQKKPGLLRRLLPGVKPDWRWAACGLMLATLIPVPQSIMARAEVTAKSPAVVASGLNAVIEEVLVRPNQKVRRGDLLVRFDSTDLTHRKNTLEQELALAHERLRKARQHSLKSTVERNEFAELASQIELKQLELDYVVESMDRLELRAESEGVVLFSRKQDWMGRSVATGEKIMEIASADDNQFEIWVAANDSIALSSGKLIKFFPEAQPLNVVKGSVDSVGFFASQSDADELAYRVVAAPVDDSDALRLGMKGTARLYGEKVLLGYHVFRKPISVIRKNVGV